MTVSAKGFVTSPRVRRVLLAATLVCLSALAGAAWWIVSLGPAPAGKELEFSTRVVDREGRLLRAYAASEGRWRLPVKVADVDPRFFDLLFAYEDKRFRTHHGVDPLALARAAFQLAGSGRIRSGGSTLTMQVARLLEPRSGRSFVAKLRQIVRAFEIERIMTKDEVLSLYLSLAPYGGNIEGIRAASLAYFGKEPRRLSLGEAALLVALPQSPELRRPDRSAEAARSARDRVLDRFATSSSVPADEIALAKAEPVPSGRRAMPMLAPHAADRAIAQVSPGSEVRLTVDADLQKSLEELARTHLRAMAGTFGPDVSLAILIVDNATGEIAARVGSPNYFDERRAGQVDMTEALRSPGSTLKPFIYGLGFEDGFIHPETLIEDRPVRYGAYAPQNFDFTFQGTVTVRRALQFSLNVPALAVLEQVGPGSSRRASRRPAPPLMPEGEAPSLAMGLGGVGIKLSDLVMLYAGIARLGTALPLSERMENGALLSPPTQAGKNFLMEPVAAWYVSNVLIGTPPPGKRRARPDRVQDRDELRLSRRPGRSASTASTRSVSGSAGPTARGVGPHRGNAAAYPFGFILLCLAAVTSPRLTRLTQGVLAMLTVRFDICFWRSACRACSSPSSSASIGRARPCVGSHDDPFAYSPFASGSPNTASMPSGHATTAALRRPSRSARSWPRSRGVMWSGCS